MMDGPAPYPRRPRRGLRARAAVHAGDAADTLFRLVGTLVQLAWDLAGEAGRHLRRAGAVATLALAGLAAVIGRRR